MPTPKTGLAADRPTVAARGRIYIASDTNAVSVSDGVEWIAVTDADAAAIAAHLADAVDAHDASAVSLLDTANDFTATELEGAAAELQSDAEAHLADTAAAHASSAISYDPTVSGLVATDVKAAIDELKAEIDALP